MSGKQFLNSAVSVGILANLESQACESRCIQNGVSAASPAKVHRTQRLTCVADSATVRALCILWAERSGVYRGLIQNRNKVNHHAIRRNQVVEPVDESPAPTSPPLQGGPCLIQQQSLRAVSMDQGCKGIGRTCHRAVTCTFQLRPMGFLRMVQPCTGLALWSCQKFIIKCAEPTHSCRPSAPRDPVVFECLLHMPRFMPRSQTFLLLSAASKANLIWGMCSKHFKTLASALLVPL